MSKDPGEKYSPRDAVSAVFQDMIEDTKSGHQGSSCFPINPVIEAAPKDAKINETAQVGLKGLEARFSNQAAAGRKTGQILG